MKKLSEFDKHFGVCPKCKKNDSFLNVERVHFFVCHKHKYWWCVGANLFACWRKENEEIWEKNERLLEKKYKPVQEIHC